MPSNRHYHHKEVQNYAANHIHEDTLSAWTEESLKEDRKEVCEYIGIFLTKPVIFLKCSLSNTYIYVYATQLCVSTYLYECFFDQGEMNVVTSPE